MAGSTPGGGGEGASRGRGALPVRARCRPSVMYVILVYWHIGILASLPASGDQQRGPSERASEGERGREGETDTDRPTDREGRQCPISWRPARAMLNKSPPLPPPQSTPPPIVRVLGSTPAIPASQHTTTPEPPWIELASTLLCLPLSQVLARPLVSPPRLAAFFRL